MAAKIVVEDRWREAVALIAGSAVGDGSALLRYDGDEQLPLLAALAKAGATLAALLAVEEGVSVEILLDALQMQELLRRVTR